ncbi:MAG: hypothetical protein JWP31_1152 [Aeromicrobium sp.]|nr:hypothetical protein [Aeromicrobium sp.]
MIYAVTSGALQDAGIGVRDLDSVCMSASDLNDGRAISTMTLTGSTGSFGIPEMRLCNDSLSSVLLGVAEIGCGAAEAIMVCSWNKLSDVGPDAIRHLGMEPVFHRGLGFHPDAIYGLAASHESKTATVTGATPLVPQDGAVAFVLTRTPSVADRAGQLSVLGVGASMGDYLRARNDVLAPAREAVADALSGLSLDVDALASVVVAGFHPVEDAAIAEALGVDPGRIVRQDNRYGDLGYASGMLGISQVAESRTQGVSLVVSAGGLMFENAFATVVEVA